MDKHLQGANLGHSEEILIQNQMQTLKKNPVTPCLM